MPPVQHCPVAQNCLASVLRRPLCAQNILGFLCSEWLPRALGHRSKHRMSRCQAWKDKMLTVWHITESAIWVMNTE